MTTWAELLPDGTIGGEELLHAPLLLTGRLVKAFCAIVEIQILAMFRSRENLTLSSTVALQFVGDNHMQHIGQTFAEIAGWSDQEQKCQSRFAA